MPESQWGCSWYPAPDVDALLRYLEGYEPHRYGLKWTR